MNASFHRTIANDFAELNDVMDDATVYLEGEGVDAQAVYRVNLALEEMVSNITKYGYDAPGQHKIEVAVEVRRDDVALQIIDDGHDFNPLLHEKPVAIDESGKRAVGGWGIDLMKTLLDRIDHRREEGRNVLEITVRRKPAAVSG
jgi:serine/threonine-protein kinase RsbW